MRQPLDSRNLNTFKSLVRRGVSTPVVVLRKPTVSVMEPAAHNARRILYTISTAAVDRERDSIVQAGWQLDAFRSNPVVLWGHDSSELPIGKAVDLDLTPDGAALRAMVEFVPEDMPLVGDRAEAVLRMSRAGFLSATSVGFRPLEFEVAKDRDTDESWFPPLNFLKQELMEFSIVSIPANPEALIDPGARVDSADAISALAAEVAAATVEQSAAAAFAKARQARLRQARLRAYA